MKDYSGLRDNLYTKNDYSIVVLILEKQTDNSRLSKRTIKKLLTADVEVRSCFYALISAKSRILR